MPENNADAAPQPTADAPTGAPAAKLQNSLMAELAGKNAGITKLEEQQYDKVDPLETAPNVPRSEIEQMDDKHATRAHGKGYKLQVRGEYYANSAEAPGKKVKRPYTITVNVAQLKNAMNVLKAKLLPALLPRKYKDYVSLRTFDVVEATPLSPESPVSTNLNFAPRNILEEYVRDHKVPIDLKDFKDDGQLRETLKDFAYNPSGFEEREKKRQADRKETAELAELNPDLAGVEVAVGQPNEPMPPVPAAPSAPSAPAGK